MAAAAALHALFQPGNRAGSTPRSQLLHHQHRASFHGMAATVAADPQVVSPTGEIIDRIERVSHSSAMERKGNEGQAPRRDPIRVYRARCGLKVWSRWFADEADAWWEAHHAQIVRYDFKRRKFMLGPLAWIEIGERAYAGRRTVPLRTDHDGRPLPAVYLPTIGPA